MRREITQGTTLTYLTVLPQDYKDDKSYPLILSLHGYGANKDDLADLARVIDPRGYLYVFPDAPQEAFAGIDPSARAWYERGGDETPEAVADALHALDGLVNEIMARYRVPELQVLLLGFSQGGAMALRYGLPRPERFAGLVVLSGSLRRVEDLRSTLPPQRRQPIFIAHGRTDALVPLEWSRQVVAFLQAERYHPMYKVHAMGHHITPQLITELRTWIRGVLRPAKIE